MNTHNPCPFKRTDRLSCSKSNLSCSQAAAMHCSECQQLKAKICPFAVSGHCNYAKEICSTEVSLTCTFFIVFCEMVCPMMVLLNYRPEVAKCDVTAGQEALHKHGVSCCDLSPDGYSCRLRRQAMLLGGRSMTPEIRDEINLQAALIAKGAIKRTLLPARVA